MSLNRALSYATGNYLARMDADDIAKKDRLEKEIRCIEQEKLDVVGSWADVIDENDAVWNEISGTYFTQDAVEKLLSNPKHFDSSDCTNAYRHGKKGWGLPQFCFLSRL